MPRKPREDSASYRDDEGRRVCIVPIQPKSSYARIHAFILGNNYFKKSQIARGCKLKLKTLSSLLSDMRMARLVEWEEVGDHLEYRSFPQNALRETVQPGKRICKTKIEREREAKAAADAVFAKYTKNTQEKVEVYPEVDLFDNPSSEKAEAVFPEPVEESEEEYTHSDLHDMALALATQIDDTLDEQGEELMALIEENVALKEENENLTKVLQKYLNKTV